MYKNSPIQTSILFKRCNYSLVKQPHLRYISTIVKILKDAASAENPWHQMSQVTFPEITVSSPEVINSNTENSKILLSIVAADSLIKRDFFKLPDPFAVVTVDGAQTHSTNVIKRSLNPYWNQSFILSVVPSSVIALQVFDQVYSPLIKRKFNKTVTQGFLGVVNVRVGDVFNLALGGDEMLTLDLKKSNNNEDVSGKIILALSSNLLQSTLGVPAVASSSSSSPQAFPHSSSTSSFTVIDNNNNSVKNPVATTPATLRNVANLDETPLPSGYFNFNLVGNVV